MDSVISKWSSLRKIITPNNKTKIINIREARSYQRKYFDELLIATSRIRRRLNNVYTYYDLNVARLFGDPFCGVQIYESSTENCYHIGKHPKTGEWYCSHPSGNPTETLKVLSFNKKEKEVNIQLRNIYIDHIRF